MIPRPVRVLGSIIVQVRLSPIPKIAHWDRLMIRLSAVSFYSDFVMFPFKTRRRSSERNKALFKEFALLQMGLLMSSLILHGYQYIPSPLLGHNP